MMVIGLGFVNPLISFGLVVLYYLPSIVRSLCGECVDAVRSSDSVDRETVKFEEYNVTINFSTRSPGPRPTDMKKFSDDTLEEMK